MKILIVDNKTKSLDSLTELLKKYGEVALVDYQDIRNVNDREYNLIVLSGSSELNVYWNKNELKEEFEFIKQTSTPLIGICFGFELLCVAYNSIMIEIPEKLDEFRFIKVIQPNPIFSGLTQPLAVKESHKWAVTELGEDLIGLAKSDSGFEIVKHNNKLQYGFQFHPELFTQITNGDTVFDTLINLLNKKKAD